MYLRISVIETRIDDVRPSMKAREFLLQLTKTFCDRLAQAELKPHISEAIADNSIFHEQFSTTTTDDYGTVFMEDSIDCSKLTSTATNWSPRPTDL